METQSNQCGLKVHEYFVRFAGGQKQQNSRIQKSNHGTRETLITDALRMLRRRTLDRCEKTKRI